MARIIAYDGYVRVYRLFFWAFSSRRCSSSEPCLKTRSLVALAGDIDWFFYRLVVLFQINRVHLFYSQCIALHTPASNWDGIRSLHIKFNEHCNVKLFSLRAAVLMIWYRNLLDCQNFTTLVVFLIPALPLRPHYCCCRCSVTSKAEPVSWYFLLPLILWSVQRFQNKIRTSVQVIIPLACSKKCILQADISASQQNCGGVGASFRIQLYFTGECRLSGRTRWVSMVSGSRLHKLGSRRRLLLLRLHKL